MESKSNSHDFNSEAGEPYDATDMRYYGVYIEEEGEKQHILVDLKRFQEIFGAKPEMETVAGSQEGSLFSPAKKRFLDYNVNYMTQELNRIRRRWEKTNKPIIDFVLSVTRGKNFEPDRSDELAVTGVLTPEEVADQARMKTLISNLLAEVERNDIYYSLHAQFFHQLASETEALFLRTLIRNGHEKEKINRDIIYAFKGSNKEKISKLDGSIYLDKMYEIWNFIKHNSTSTFEKLKKRFPETLKDDNYTQGELACFHVKFDDDLIDSILNGLDAFIRGYCRLAFKENEKEARWNCEEYFYKMAREEIYEIEDPFGLRFELF